MKPQTLPFSSPAVLLLEPDEKVQQLIRMILRRDGLSVVTAKSGDGAVREFFRRNFSAFIVDISIWTSILERGARRGVGFLHFLQRTDPSVLERVVVTSALNDRDLPLEMPAVHRLIHKPFDIDELRKAVAECVLAA
ncbi:MAG: response regulator [Thermoanaerobaculia bacterium]